MLFQNDDGSLGLWDMNGAAISQSGVVADPGPARRRRFQPGRHDPRRRILTGTEPLLADEVLFGRLKGGGVVKVVVTADEMGAKKA